MHVRRVDAAELGGFGERHGGKAAIHINNRASIYGAKSVLQYSIA
jgi:hypothetical protein